MHLTVLDKDVHLVLLEYFIFPKVNTIEFELPKFNSVKNVLLAVYTKEIHRANQHHSVPLKYIPTDVQGTLNT